MLTETLIEDERWREVRLDSLAEAAGQATFEHLRLDPDACVISVLGCDDARIASLNAMFRDRPTATDVLSWPSAERGAPVAGAAPKAPETGMDGELGDVAIAFDTCLADADAIGRPPADHITHLLVHAVLHLLGFDHLRDEDATLMEAMEVAILGKMGIDTPYCDDRG